MKRVILLFAAVALAVFVFEITTPAPSDARPAAAPEQQSQWLVLLFGGGMLLLGGVRVIQDARTNQTVALPAAAATAYTPSIDVGTGPHVERCEFRLSLPATPSLVDTKTITCRLQDSADNVTFADIAALGTLVVTGAGGVGAAAANLDLRLPSTANRYIRASATVLAAGGSNIAQSLTLAVLM